MKVEELTRKELIEIVNELDDYIKRFYNHLEKLYEHENYEERKTPSIGDMDIYDYSKLLLKDIDYSLKRGHYLCVKQTQKVFKHILEYMDEKLKRNQCPKCGGRGIIDG